MGQSCQRLVDCGLIYIIPSGHCAANVLKHGAQGRWLQEPMGLMGVTPSHRGRDEEKAIVDH